MSEHSGFFVDWAAIWMLIGVVLLYIVWHLVRPLRKKRGVYYSDVSLLKGFHRGLRYSLRSFPKVCYGIGLVFLALAWIDPHRMEEESKVHQMPEQEKKEAMKKGPKQLESIEIPTRGIALYFVLDQSGSMAQPIGESQHRRSRLDMLKQVTSQFIQGSQHQGLAGRSSDLIGLIAFARVAKVISPLTLDHKEVLYKLSQLSTVQHQDEDGTALGYAIYKTASLIAATRHFAHELVQEKKPGYEVLNSVIILVTDGFQNPSSLDESHSLRNIAVLEAAQFAKEKNIKVYIINIEPLVQLPQYSHYSRELEKAAKLTGGKYYVTGSSHVIAQLYDQIDRLEKSQLPVKKRVQAKVEEKQLPPQSKKEYRRISYYPELMGIGFIFLALGFIANTLVLRRVP